jgi:hypothetical protein
MRTHHNENRKSNPLERVDPITHSVPSLRIRRKIPIGPENFAPKPRDLSCDFARGFEKKENRIGERKKLAEKERK